MIFNMNPARGKKLPVLNSSLPADASIKATGSATFKIEIQKHGYPEEYTYQWYVNGAAVSGATGMSFTKATTKSDGGTYTVFCAVTNKAGTINSRTATLKVDDSKYRAPVFTYSGSYKLTNDSGTTISQGSLNEKWKLKFLTGGDLKFTTLNSASSVDVFCVGGGGGGAGGSTYAGGGGAGGKTTTKRGVTLTAGKTYTIAIGAGGAKGSGGSNGGKGGTTSAFEVTAAGGGGGYTSKYSTGGGSGGSGGGGAGHNAPDNAGDGGSNGGNGKDGAINDGGAGQGSTTREFGESGGTLYAGGGGGGASNNSGAADVGSGGSGGGGKGAKNKGSATQGTDNLGGGGGGACSNEAYSGAKGGSGIVVIRNAR